MGAEKQWYQDGATDAAVVEHQQEPTPPIKGYTDGPVVAAESPSVVQENAGSGDAITSTESGFVA
jgi:hypothetical protein